MVQAHLSEEEMKAVLARAEEIHLQNRTSGEFQAMLRAAEEAGLPREAVEQALQERIGTVGAPPKVGELVFARSADEKYYVAEVLAADEDSVRVKFLKAGEHAVRPNEIRPAKFLPGDRVVCPWPVWGWWGCTVLSYNEAKKKVKVSDGWGSTESFSIADIRLDPPRVKKARTWGRTKAYLTMYALGLLSGGAVTALAYWLLLR